MTREAEALLKRYFEIDLPADTLVKDLTTAQQKIVQITCALARKASILVLDEPTAALVKRELNSLFSVLRRLRDEGIAVIFISHCTQEIEELCDEVTVMRNGTDVGVVDPKRTSRSSCPSNHASRGPRSPRCSAACAGFFCA
jgi:ribose transport system ATP-binding protein